MPTKKSRHVAARQAQLRERAKKKAHHGPGPSLPAFTNLARTDASPASTSMPKPESSDIPTATRPPAPITPAHPLRRERLSPALLTTVGLRSELLRIGIVASLVAGVLLGLKLGTNLGA